MKRKTKLIVTGLLILMMIGSLTGYEFVNSKVQSMKGSITGNEYIADFYTKNFDYPEKTLKYKHIRRISD